MYQSSHTPDVITHILQITLKHMMICGSLNRRREPTVNVSADEEQSGKLMGYTPCTHPHSHIPIRHCLQLGPDLAQLGKCNTSGAV